MVGSGLDRESRRVRGDEGRALTIIVWIVVLAIVGFSSLGGLAAGITSFDSTSVDRVEPTSFCDGADFEDPDSPPPGEVETSAPPAPAPLAPVDVTGGAEHISAMHIAVTLDEQGDATIRETITYDFGDLERRGILRQLVVSQACTDEYDRVWPLEVVGVGSDTAPEMSVLEDTGTKGVRQIRVGDEDIYITGEHTYAIEYRLEGVTNGFPFHDEFYWNVTGHGWDVLLTNVTVTVESPAATTQVACFQGYVGSVQPCDAVGAVDGNAAFGAEFLQPGEGITVVAAYPKEAMAEPVAYLHERWSLARAFSLTPLTVFGSIALLAVIVGTWSLVAHGVGRDRQLAGSHVDVAFAPVGSKGSPKPYFGDDITPVEFVPPDDIRPGQVGVLVDEKVHPVDVTATIMDLAVRGYLRIEEIPDPAADREGLTGAVARLTSRMKGTDYRIVRLDVPSDDLEKYERTTLNKLVARKGGSVDLSDLKTTFSKKFKTIVDEMYDDTVQRGWFATRPDKVRTMWTGIGVAALVVSLLVLAAAVMLTEVALLAIPLVVGAVLMLVGAKWMPRRTAAGTGLLSRTRGFEIFIRDSEAPRAQWAEQKNIFSEYLPYAIVFGCADMWAQTFDDLGDQAISEGGGWYVGTAPFRPVYFVGSMNDFASTAGSSLSAPPPGSSGGSGFSGGSGGGGGGGGGGSW